MRNFITFLFDVAGATAIEYGLLAGILGGAIILGIGAFGVEMANIFDILGQATAP